MIKKNKKPKKRIQETDQRKRNARGQGEQLRSELIDAAIALLARLEPEEPFSLRSVAKEAGVAAPSVYLQFEDRDALLTAVLEKIFSEKITRQSMAEEKVAKAGGGAWEKLLARCMDTVKFALEKSGHYKVLYEGRVAARLEHPKAAAFGRPLMDRTKELIAEIIKKNKAQRVSQDPERLSLLLWAGTHGVLSLIINKPTHEWPPAKELVEQMAVALIRPFN